MISFCFKTRRTSVRWFQVVYFSIFALFMGLMVFVVIVAYGRPSNGNTGMDIAEIHKIRFHKEEP